MEEIQSLGIVGAAPVESTLNLKGMNYLEWCKCVSSFLSLDISVHGTGWVTWKDGKLEWGRISLVAEDEAGRVEEFRKALLSVINGYSFDYIFVEDAIGSCNYKTARSLYVLNGVIDILIYEKLVTTPIALHRVSNVTWKKDLRSIAGSDFVVKGVAYTNGADKEATKACLTALGVSIEELKAGKYTNKQVEDICDALGMALGTIASKIEKTPMVKSRALTTDIRKGYKIKQFFSYADAVKSANRSAKAKSRNVIEFDLVDNKANDLIRFMANELPNDPTGIYVVHVPVSKCCNLLLMKRLEVKEPECYLVIMK